jgi:Rrf2 family protein
LGAVTTIGPMLTNRAKYAIKALLYLARHRGEGPIGAGVIAESGHIPLKFLELILLQLRNHGMIRSKVGKGGGHELVQGPGEITVLSVVRIIDGPVAPLPCLSHTAYQKCEDCDDEKTCGTRRLFKQVHDASVEIMSNTTLADAGRKRPTGSC